MLVNGHSPLLAEPGKTRCKAFVVNGSPIPTQCLHCVVGGLPRVAITELAGHGWHCSHCDLSTSMRSTTEDVRDVWRDER